MRRPVRHSVGVRDGGGSLLWVKFLFCVFCAFLRLFPDSLPLSVFVSLCEIFLRLLLRVDSRFLFAACHAVACEGGSIRGCYSRSASVIREARLSPCVRFFVRPSFCVFCAFLRLFSVCPDYFAP